MNHSFLVSIFSQILLDILVINFTYVYWIDSESTHCVKRVQIRRFFGPYFPAFGLNTEKYSVSVFSPNVGKYGQEKTPYLDSFHTVTNIV